MTQISEYSQFIFEPHFFSFLRKVTNGNLEQNIWNIETGEVLNTGNKILTRTFSWNDKVYLVFGTEIREYGSDYSISLKKNFYVFGGLLVCHTYFTPKTFDIIDLLSGKVLYESLETVQSENDLLMFQNNNNETFFLNEFGQIFYSLKNTKHPRIHTIVNGTRFNENFKIYAIVASDNSWAIVSSLGKIYKTGQERFQRIFNSNVLRMDDEIGYYVDEKDEFTLHHSVGDFYHLSDGYFVNKLEGHRQMSDQIAIVDKDNVQLINIIFERLDLLRFYHSDDLLLFGIANGKIVLLDRSLTTLNVPFENNPNFRLNRVQVKHGNTEESEETYFKVYDKETKLVHAIMDSKFNLINLNDDVIEALYHPLGKYFAIFYKNGDFGYMRFDGTKLH